MAESDLLTPQVSGWSTWTILVSLLVYLAVGIWQLSQERFLSRDSVELSYLDAIITGYSVYYGTEAVIRLCLAGILIFIKKYGLKPFLLYIGFITVLSSVLVVYLMHWAAIGTIRDLQTSVVIQLENSVIEVEERRGRIKRINLPSRLLYSVEERIKYSGEDGVFECFRVGSVEHFAAPEQVVWEKYGRWVRPPDHINKTLTIKVILRDYVSKDGLEHNLLVLKITSTSIYTAGFGHYSSMVQEIVPIRKTIQISTPKHPADMYLCIRICDAVTPLPPPKLELELSMDKSGWKDEYDTIRVFSLTRMQELTRIVRAPAGGIVSFSANYDHLGPIDDVSFDYTIGGTSFDFVCGGILNQCSFLVRFYWSFFHEEGLDIFFTTTIGRVRLQTAVTSIGWQCVCKEAYANHEFWFYREIDNVTSGRQETREVRHLHPVILTPRTPDFFSNNFTDTVNPLAKETCWIGPKNRFKLTTARTKKP